MPAQHEVTSQTPASVANSVYFVQFLSRYGTPQSYHRDTTICLHSGACASCSIRLHNIEETITVFSSDSEKEMARRTLNTVASKLEDTI